MPSPIPVELVQHKASWAAQAVLEADRLRTALGPVLDDIHHIGSTAIPGLRSKPVIDLLVVVSDLKFLDGCRKNIERLGYVWWGEHGLPGRRYCTRDDAVSLRRSIQLHAYARTSSEEIKRHLAFRDHLRAHPELAAEYEREKQRCAALHSESSHDYGDCKSAWVERIEAEAMSTRFLKHQL